MIKNRKQLLDDIFDSFSILSDGNYISLYDTIGKMTRYSKGAVELFNLPGEYILDGAYNWVEYVHPEDRTRYLNIMSKLVTTDSMFYDLTYRVKINTGEYASFRFMGSVIRDDEGKPSLIGGKIVNESLKQNTDVITVLKNQYGFMEDLSEILKTSNRTTVLMIGLSGLDVLNELYGYSYGNRILQQVSWSIQESVQNRGTVYRLEGSKFAVVTTSTPEYEIAALYDSIQLKLQKGIRIGSMRHGFSTNGSLISCGTRQLDSTTLFSALSYAYKESKLKQKGHLVDYNGTASSKNENHFEILNAVRNDIFEGCKHFFMEYQPVLNKETKKIIGVESFIRWKNEEFGMVEPTSFLPVLEQDFVFDELSTWILKQTMTEAKLFLQKDPNFILGINIAPIQIEDEYFVENILFTAKHAEFPVQNLCLELTKNCRLLNKELLKSTVNELHKHNIKVIIDDFGSGFDSVAFLQELSADYIKFDATVIRDIEINQNTQETIKNFAQVGALYGANTCIKHIETQEADEIIKNLPVRSCQGYFYAHPAGAEDIAKLVGKTI